MNKNIIIPMLIYFTLIFIFINSNKKNKELFGNNELYNVYVLYVLERENYIKNLVNKINLNTNIHFIKGIDKNNINCDELINTNKITSTWLSTKIKPIKYIKTFNNGRVACHLGHINILSKFLKSTCKFALILEDDINLEGDFQELNKKINYIINHLPKDADIVYLSYCFEICSKLKNTNEIFIEAYRPLCRHFYLVTKKGARIIIDNTLPMYSSGDRMIGTLISKNILKGYIINPSYLKINQKRNDNSNFKTLLDNTQPHRLCL